VTYNFADCQGFAGGFSCGATLAGFKLVAKREQKSSGGFGIPMMEANRQFLGESWDSQVAEPADWDLPAQRADVVLGTPPCSAFSGMTAGTSAHGVDSKINDCMRELIRYAARTRPAVVLMESVSQAYTKGQVLMHQLWQDLQRQSGLRYECYHVLQDNYSVGGCSKRKRYFLVLSQVPFGVEVPELKWLPAVADAVSDLRTLPVSWELQRVESSPTWWSHGLRSLDSTVDGHVPPQNGYTWRQLALNDRGIRWEEGDREADVLRRYYDAHGELPEAFAYQSAGSHLTRDKVLIERGLDPGGFSQTRCWRWDEPATVINGAGPFMIMHPDGRHFTHREVARVMGFPDDWLCGDLREDRSLHAYWGKGTSVHPARWVMDWVRESLDGSPGSVTGVPQPDGSYLIDVMRNWKDARDRLARPVASRQPEPAALTVARKQSRLPQELAEKPRRTRREPPAAVSLYPSYPGWEYARKPSSGPRWTAESLDRLVQAAILATGSSVPDRDVAALVNSPAFRTQNGAGALRGCSAWHAKESRRRLQEAARGTPVGTQKTPASTGGQPVGQLV
jgi:site-specific DNA-cytosine methylase